MSWKLFISKIESLEDVDTSPSPARTDTQTRQKSSAAAQTLDPAPLFLQKFLDQAQATADIIWYQQDGQLISLGWRYWTILFSYHSGCRNCSSPVLIQAEGLETAALCTWWTPGPWTGPATPEVQWSVAWDSQNFVINTFLHIILYYYINHYYVLLCSLFLHCYDIIITHYYSHYYCLLLKIHFYVLLHHYYNIIELLLHHFYL